MCFVSFFFFSGKKKSSKCKCFFSFHFFASFLTQTAVAGCPARVRVAAHVALGRAGTLVSALFEVRLVRFAALSLSYAAHPAGPANLSRLRRIRCTQAYESARPVVLARLSSDAEIEVTESSSFLQMTPAVASLDMASPPSRPLLRAHAAQM